MSANSPDSVDVVDIPVVQPEYPISPNWPNRKGRPYVQDDPTAPLTSKQEMFVAEWLIDLNGAQAAIRAGYSTEGARVTASKLLAKPNVRTEIYRQYRAIYSSLGVKAQRVLAELVRIGFSDVRELFDGNGQLLDVKSLPDSIAAAVSSVEVVRRPGRPGGKGDGDDTDEYIHKIRLWDKTKALAMLGKHFGILKDVLELEHSGQVGVKVEHVAGIPFIEELTADGKREFVELLERERARRAVGGNGQRQGQLADGRDNGDGDGAGQVIEADFHLLADGGVDGNLDVDTPDDLPAIRIVEMPDGYADDGEDEGDDL